MSVLKDWDFGNEENNSKSSLINRQKSAIRLEVVSIDLKSSTGIFFDSRNGRITASHKHFYRNIENKPLSKDEAHRIVITTFQHSSTLLNRAAQITQL